MKVLITGGNRGIGKATAEKLLLDNYEVVITSRDIKKGETAVSELKELTGKASIECIQGDLSDIQSCFALAGKIKTQHPDIQVFISNAGIMQTEKKLNKDGLEMSFMVNYVAPYILCHELLPVLEKNAPARIVNVNSKLYERGSLDMEKTPVGEDFSALKTYAASKLCNALFAIDFAKEIEGQGVTINTVHPGIINTGLGDSKKLISIIFKLIKPFWKKPEYGAIAPVWLATSDELEGVSGKYFEETTEKPFTDYVQDEARRQQLKTFTEELIRATKAANNV